MIRDIRLQQFRSYIDESFEFTPAVNIIVGPNASGKTNLLEALLVMSQGSSYRARDSELVMFRKPWARIDAHTDRETRTVKLVAEPQPGKTYELDAKPYKRLSLVRTLPAVLFEPNHLSLLHGSPQGRRSYLDELLRQTDPAFASQARNYSRTLAQRNALLKRSQKLHSGGNSGELFPWNLRLSELGAVISRKRAELGAGINARITRLYQELSHTKLAAEVTYEPQFALDAYESLLLHRLDTDAQLDVARGFTAAGPHREDFAVLFDGRPAAEVASRGEVRTLVLALKVIELEIVRAARDTEPMLLLDDVFSELDGARRHALTTQLQPYQTFITTTDADLVQKSFAAKAHIIPLGR